MFKHILSEKSSQKLKKNQVMHTETLRCDHISPDNSLTLEPIGMLFFKGSFVSKRQRPHFIVFFRLRFLSYTSKFTQILEVSHLSEKCQYPGPTETRDF